MRVSRARRADWSAGGAPWGLCLCAAVGAVASACAGQSTPVAEEPVRAEMAVVPAPAIADRGGSMTLPGADGATTRFGEAMGLEDLPDWLVVPEGVSSTGEGFVVTSAEGRRTGSIRLSMSVGSEAAVSAWAHALSAGGLHVQRQDAGDAEASFVVASGDRGRRVHVAVTAAPGGVACSVQFAGG